MTYSSPLMNHLSHAISHREPMYMDNTPLFQLKKKILPLLQMSTFPSIKDEFFRYSKIQETDFDNLDFNPPPIRDTASTLLSNQFSGYFKYQIIFVNGELSLEQTMLPKELELKKIIDEDEALEVFASLDQSNFFGLMNILYTSNIYKLTIPKDFKSSEIISTVHITTGDFKQHLATPCLFIKAKENSYTNFFSLYHYAGIGPHYYVTNSALYLDLENGAVVDFSKLQMESKLCLHISTIQASLKENSILNTQLISLGGHHSRENQKIHLLGQNARVNLYGLYDLKDDMQTDHYVEVVHQHQQTYSHQIFKGILRDQSHGVFTGKVLITKDAKHSVSTQLNKNIILGDAALMTSRPQLMIDTDDVKCTHGATTGQLDPEQLFYLNTRGIEKDQAKKMLYHAFAREIIEASPCGKIKQILNNFILNDQATIPWDLNYTNRCQHGIFSFT